MFKDAPDLLAEFKKFLPNAIPASPGPNGMAPLPQTGLGYAGPPYPPDDSPPNHAAKKPPPSKRNRKRVPEKEATPVPPPKPVPSRVCVISSNSSDHFDERLCSKRRKSNIPIIKTLKQLPFRTMPTVLILLPSTAMVKRALRIFPNRDSHIPVKCKIFQTTRMPSSSYFSIEQKRPSRVARITKIF